MFYVAAVCNRCTHRSMEAHNGCDTASDGRWRRRITITIQRDIGT